MAATGIMDILALASFVVYGIALKGDVLPRTLLGYHKKLVANFIK
jgi:hypothetical protein